MAALSNSFPPNSATVIRTALRASLCGWLAAAPLRAQGPGASAAPVFPPSQLQGLLQIEADSGAARLDFPLGPGIGSPELRYGPRLVGRFAPQVGLLPLAPAREEPDLAPALLATTAFTLAPGTLEGWFPAASGSGDLTPGPSVTWTGPEGGGTLGAAQPETEDTNTLRTRFGYAPLAGPRLPTPFDASPAGPRAAPGAGADLLLVLADACPRHGELPSSLLVIRGTTAYEFSYSESRETLLARYRLTAIRNEAGEAVTFTYGPNGVDYEATWKDLKVRVALEGVAHIPPAPALDDALPPFAPEAAALAVRSVVARLRVTYEGLEAPLSYSLTALARPEFQHPDGTFAGGFRRAASGGEALQDSFRANLQVNTLRQDGTGEAFRFRYGKAPTLIHPGRDGDHAFAPTILQEISHPGRSIRLTWACQTPAGPCADTDRTAAAQGPWSYGVCLVEDRDGTGQGEPVTTHPTAQGLTLPLVLPLTEDRGLAAPAWPRLPLPGGGLKGGMLPGGPPLRPGTPLPPQAPPLPTPPSLPGWPPQPPPDPPRPPSQPPWPRPPALPGWPPQPPGQLPPPNLPGLPQPPVPWVQIPEPRPRPSAPRPEPSAPARAAFRPSKGSLPPGVQAWGPGLGASWMRPSLASTKGNQNATPT